MKKKSQIIGQVFIFILAAALFILILMYGYKAISGFGEKSEQVALVEFQSNLESSVKSMSMDYGSVKKVELILPSKYREICFVDFEKQADQGLESKYPRMYDAWVSKTQNVFLVPMEETPINIGNIYLGDNGWICIGITEGQLVLRLEGLGKKVGISQWQQ